MARLTISLPEELKKQLEERATQRRLPVSQVACEALQASLASPAPPSPIPGEHGDGGTDPEVRRYLSRLVLDLEHVRSTLDELALINGPLSHPPPTSFLRPPWPS